MTEDKRDNSKLPDLPDLPELEELEGLPELEQLPEMDELEPIKPELAAPLKETKVQPARTPAKPLPTPEPALAKPKAAAVAPLEPAEAPAEPAPQGASTGEAAGAVAAASIVALGSEQVVAAPAPLAPGQKPPMRTLEKAVQHLRLAAMIVAAGAILPFITLTDLVPEGGYGNGIWFSFLAKLVGALGAWVLYKQICHNWGPKLPGLVGKLADTGLIPKPKEGEKPKRKAQSKRNPEAATLDHPFPTLLHITGLAIILAAIALAIEDPRTGKAGPVGLVEYAMFTWAVLTYVHIAGYERWGKFNPLFALLFLGMLLVGVSSVFAALDLTGMLKITGILGGLLVGGGGGMAAFTIVEAMMQAKKEGDIKKSAAIEARKAARVSSRKN